MENIISLEGQWGGTFVYGPEYGEKMHGEKVEFKFFLKDRPDNQFEGTSVDVDGFGTNMDTAIIIGFMDGDTISFTKEYSKHFVLTDDGVEDASPSPRLHYIGEYNSNSKSFSGTWELWANEELTPNGSIVDIFTGIWSMQKDI